MNANETTRPRFRLETPEREEFGYSTRAVARFKVTLVASGLALAAYVAVLIGYAGNDWRAIGLIVLALAIRGLNAFAQFNWQLVQGVNITFDRQRQTVELGNLDDSSAFNIRRPPRILQFSEIHAAELRDRGFGTSGIHVLTSQGLFFISARIPRYLELVARFREIARQDRVNPEDLEDFIARPVPPRTPWYGWVILAATIAGVIYLGWWMMYGCWPEGVFQN